MSLRCLRAIICVLVSLFPLCAAAQGAAVVPQEYTSKTRVTSGSFGTVSSLCVFDNFEAEGALDRYDALWEAAKALLAQMDSLLSTSIPTSEIARFNALASGESMAVSPMTAHAFELARSMYEKTDGYYNPAVFPLVDLWGFSPRFTFGTDKTMPYDRAWEDGAFALPDAQYIEGFLQLADMDGIVLEGDEEHGYTLHKKTPPVTIDGVTYQAQIDLGGIAKGYAADLVTQMLLEAGVEYGYFSCGSSSIRLLRSASFSSRKENDPSFRLQVRIPRETENTKDAYALIRVMDEALSSSGDYDHNYMAGGNLCSHIIDPFSGYPLNFAQEGVQQGICTATILSGSAAEDDALTTALCLMGPARAIDYINEHLREQRVAFVLYRADSDSYEVVTNIPQSDLTLLDDAYRLASEVDGEGRIVYTGELFDLP